MDPNSQPTAVIGTMSQQQSLVSMGQQRGLAYNNMMSASNALNLPAIPEQLPVKKSLDRERLKRRMDGYRKHHADCVVRHEQSLTTQWKQSQEETMNLKQRYLEAKSIRQVKSAKDKKFVSTDINNSLIPVSNLLSSDAHMPSKFLKRCRDDLEVECLGVPSKKSKSSGTNTDHGGNKSKNSANEATTKFSVEIVQQLEFTTSSMNNNPQQISTNVTVKALTNASVKSSNGCNNDDSFNQNNDPCPRPPTYQAPAATDNNKADHNKSSNKSTYECKTEPDTETDDFADFSFTKFIKDEGGQEIPDDFFTNLISDVSTYSEFMNDFDFATDTTKTFNESQFTNKIPNSCYNQRQSTATQVPRPQKPQQQQQRQSQSQSQHNDLFDLKQLPFIKQEINNDYETIGPKRSVSSNGAMKFSPYHGGSSTTTTPSPDNYSIPRSTPPRPPSSNSFSANNQQQHQQQQNHYQQRQQPQTNLHINQAQQVHINQFSRDHNLHLSAGQHMNLNSEVKGNVSFAAQQGMYFNRNQQQKQQPQHHMQPQSQSQQKLNLMTGGDNINLHQNSNMYSQVSNQQQPSLKSFNALPVPFTKGNVTEQPLLNQQQLLKLQQQKQQQMLLQKQLLQQQQQQQQQQLQLQQHKQLLQQQQQQQLSQTQASKVLETRPPPPDYKTTTRKVFPPQLCALQPQQRPLLQQQQQPASQLQPQPRQSQLQQRLPYTGMTQQQTQSNQQLVNHQMLMSQQQSANFNQRINNFLQNQTVSQSQSQSQSQTQTNHNYASNQKFMELRQQQQQQQQQQISMNLNNEMKGNVPNSDVSGMYFNQQQQQLALAQRQAQLQSSQQLQMQMQPFQRLRPQVQQQVPQPNAQLVSQPRQHNNIQRPPPPQYPQQHGQPLPDHFLNTEIDFLF